MVKVVSYLIHLGKGLYKEVPVVTGHITALEAVAEASQLAVNNPEKKVTIEFVTSET